MLKKLVKYGNSNALVLDKTILELLDIQEGGIVRIRINGNSIVITPHENVASEKINETYTAKQAHYEAMAKEFIKNYKNIDETQKETLGKELTSLFEKRQQLMDKLFQKQDYMNELGKMQTQNPEPTAHWASLSQKLEELKAQHAPELVALEKQIASFDSRVKGVSEIPVEQTNQMASEMGAVHKKFKDAITALGELIHKPEYIHEEQLLAERFKNDFDSAEYIKASNELRYGYIPELREHTQELLAVAKKYNSNC